MGVSKTLRNGPRESVAHTVGGGNNVIHRGVCGVVPEYCLNTGESRGVASPQSSMSQLADYRRSSSRVGRNVGVKWC